jgi:hypothetical protein
MQEWIVKIGFLKQIQKNIAKMHSLIHGTEIWPDLKETSFDPTLNLVWISILVSFVQFIQFIFQIRCDHNSGQRDRNITVGKRRIGCFYTL